MTWQIIETRENKEGAETQQHNLITASIRLTYKDLKD